MKDSETAGDSFDVAHLVLSLSRWWKVLLLIGAVAFTLTFIAVKLATPLFESYAILYPTRSNNREKQLEEFAYGFEIQSERLMQLLESDIILDSVSQRFGLTNHYDIDTTDIAWYDRLLKKARDRIRFHKTRYSSVVISVMDEKPETAAAIANDIARLVNGVNADIVKSNAREVLEAVEEEYERRRGRVSVINDSINQVQKGNANLALQRLQEQVNRKQKNITRLRKQLDQVQKAYQVYDFETQINVLSTKLATARADKLEETGRLSSLEKDSNRLGDSLKVLARAGKAGASLRVTFFEAEISKLSGISRDYNAMQDELEQEKVLMQIAIENLEELNNRIAPRFATRSLESLEKDYDWDQLQTLELKRKYQRALSNYLEPAPAAYLISRARPSYIKVYPHTLTSLILGTLGALIFAMVVIIFYERLQKGEGK